MALSVSCQSLSNGSGKQTTNKNPNLSTARLIVDFINSIGPLRKWRDVRHESEMRTITDIFWRSAAKLLKRDEARRIEAYIAELSGLPCND